MNSKETGISFSNILLEQEDFDVFRYRNYYNGGGVGLADFNNDGLTDVYLTSNMGDNKLFINKGNWTFEDITERAGVKGTKVWSTGVSIADVNGDGLLDIYVCNAGDVKGGNRENELFINNGNLTFTDKAVEYGLADKGFTTHAAFFDFDKDGDLDCYVLNNSYRPVSTLGYRNLRHVRDEFGGHKLYRNDNNRFIDISEQAGIYGSVIGFGLGVTVGDVNQDSWPDLYISNDFYERDYLYINNQKGGFDEKLESYMGHISMFSMGADLADINNDGYPEIFSTDMLPEQDYRLKTLISFETYDIYQLRLKNGYYHQFMRNMLHLNNKDGSFSEIGFLSGVAATDWSWGALIVDLNNDMNKEIFVCNGIYKDVIDQDFVEYLGSSEQMRAAIEGKKIDFKQFVNGMPSQKLSNYVFTQQEELSFKNVSQEWGLGEPGFSNGAAYGDLDNDGDLDLIVSNVNQEVSVYKNNSREQLQNNFIGFTFKGTDKNLFGLGTAVRAYTGNQILSFDHMPIRGFQSSMDYKMIIGVGKSTSIDSIEITWPDQKKEVMRNVAVNQVMIVDNKNATATRQPETKDQKRWLQAVITDSIIHRENNYNDFDRDRLQYHMLSTQGPAFAKADLNGDRLDDLFLGGSVGNPGAIYLQTSNYRFEQLQTNVFLNDKDREAVGAAFFDMDNDGDDDLYVATGGSETSLQSISSTDRLYENKGLKNGKPVFEVADGKIPKLYQIGSCVRPVDVDNDKDIDLFVGTRVIPGYYGRPCDQVLLINDGKGTFTDATSLYAPALKNLGMVTDAEWFDHDNNGYPDLLVVGEWMPVTLFMNDGKQLIKHEAAGLSDSQGWWNSIEALDTDRDGDMDFILGNLGLNSRFKPTQQSPIKLYVQDFDQNGSIEPVFAYEKDGKEYPFALRQEIIKQMSSLKKKFLYYRDYANKSMSDIFDPKLMERATKLVFTEANTSLLKNNGLSGFEIVKLPAEAQFSPVFGAAGTDVDGDKIDDIILGGNLFAVKPEIGRYDALHGLVLKNDGKGNFMSIPSTQSGVHVTGEVRHISVLNSKSGKLIAFVRNDNSIVFYRTIK